MASFKCILVCIISLQLLCKMASPAPSHDSNVEPQESELAEISSTQEDNFICTDSNNEALQLSWQDRVIPYSMDANMMDTAKENVTRAMWQWETVSNFIFVPRNSESQFILFSNSESCCLESVSAGNIQYQLLHVMSCSESAFSGLIGSISGLETLSHSGDNQDKEICGGLILGSITTNGTQGVHEGGNIQTPQHPSKYPHNIDCTWKLRAPEGYAVRVEFEVVEIEKAPGCRFDYLNVSNLDSKGEVIRHRKLCSAYSLSQVNSKTPQTVKTDRDTTSMVLHFHSDDTYSWSGFKLHYEFIETVDPCSHDNGGCEQLCTSEPGGGPTCGCLEGYILSTDGKTCHDLDECTVKKGGCQHKCQNTVGSFFCTCRSGFRLNHDALTCSKCNHSLETLPSGHITSPRHPAPYPHTADNCIWTLTPWLGHRLRLTLHHLDVSPSEKCKTDYLKLTSGHFPNQRRLCGHGFNISYVTTEVTKVRFHSLSENTQHTGFDLSFRQVPEGEISESELEYVSVAGSQVRYSKRHWIPLA